MPDALPYDALVQFELGGIQQYITEGLRLRDIRGASALLDEVNRTLVPARLQDAFGDAVDVIRASGSVTLLGLRRGADVTPDAATRLLRRLYRDEVPGSASYAAAVAVQEGDTIQDLLTRLSFAVAREQGSAPAWDAATAQLGPLSRFCAVCGLRPAATARTVGGDHELVCRACQRRGDYGTQVRRARSAPLGRYARYAAQQGASSHAPYDLLPDDFDALTGEDDLALILADGNRLGATLRQLTDLDQYRAFSEGIVTLVEEALFEALHPHAPGPDAQGACLPWEILYVGGDDLLIATRAALALDVALDVIGRIEAKSAALFDDLGLSGAREHLTMAAGVAIADPHYPFASLRHLAGQLERAAKQKGYRLYREAGRDASTVDVHRITASGRITLDDVRSRELVPRRQGAGERNLLTRRPFTTDELRDVLGVARRWRAATGRARLPHSKVHYLREALFTSPAEAAFAWAHVLGRAGDEERRVWSALAELTGGADGAALMPWAALPDGDVTRATYLLDVIDLYELMGSTD